MRKLTFNQSLRGRWLLLLFALLLQPSGLQAEDYGITIAGVEVTSDNALSITGANITSGTVSFDASTNTLTLNNVTMSGNVVSSIANLNVKLVGVSTFNIDNSNGDSEYYLFQSTITTATLTFSADQLGATLQGYGTSTSINYNVNLNYWFDVAYDNEAYWSSTTTQMDDRDYCQVSKPYVTVDGSAINEANKDNPDITGVSFDLTNNKVTLTDFHRDNQSYNSYSLITSNIANLNVDIQGELNYIYLNTRKTNQEITSRGFIYTGASGQESSLNVTVAEGSKLLLSWSGETATTNWLQDGFAQTNMALDKTKMQEAGVLAEAGVPYDYQMTISNYTPPVSYGITVGGVEVTSENASDILSDDQVNAEKVSYNAQTNTLTLNGVNISGYTSTNGCITTNRSALNIAISGNNTLDCSSDTCTTIRSTLQGGTALTFVKGGDKCSLTLKGGHAIRDFASVTVSSGLYWDDAYTYEMGTTNFGSGMSLRNPVGQETYSTEATNAFLSDGQPLGLIIGGVKVTTSNADNVFDDSHQSVSYDATNHKLTLKGSNFSNGITCNETITDLTLHLVGYNAIYGDFIVASPQATTLHFTTSTKLPGSLHLGSSNNSNLLDCTIDYQNGLSYEDGVIQAESEDAIIASFTGYVGYINEQTNSDYIYSGNKEFYASKAVCNANNNSVIVSTKESETSASMWPTSINTSSLKTILVQYDWGTNTNKNVTVQIRGLNQDEFDGNTYSEAISLSDAGADGIVEITLNKRVTSENVQIYFSSDNAFSFMPLSIAFADYPSFGISVCNTKVNELNADNVLGDGKVSYDVEKNTLILNKATLDMSNQSYTSPVESSIQNLTVKLIGETQVTIADGSDYPYVFKYIGEEQTATLTLETEADESGAFGSLVASGVEELGNFCPGYELSPELHVASDQTDGWEYSLQSTGFSSTLTVSYMEYYDLWFSDERFTSSKRDAGFSGTMSYDDSKKTLTLGGEFAYSSAVVRSQMPTLKIELAGTNTISDVIFQATNDVTSGTLTIVVKEGTPELKLYTTDDAQPFGGFSNVSYENKLHLTHVENDQQNYYLVDVKVPQEPNYHFTDDATGQSSYPNGSTVYNLYFGVENTLPWLMGAPDGLAITYRSSDEATATINQEGQITLTGAGHVWIYASNEETDDYVAHTDSIRLEIRPMDPQSSIVQGAYYTGQTLTLISTVPNGEMYYRIGYEGDRVKYTEPIVLEKGKWEISLYTKCGPANDEMWSYGNNHPVFYVYDELTFTPESGASSNDNITVEIGNLPSATEANPNTTHIYYFFGDDDEDYTNDLEYNTTDKVNVAESTKVNAYIEVEGDSGYVYKTEPVEAEYTVIPKTQLNISYASNSRQWASYYADEKSLETPEGLEANVVTEVTATGVTVSPITYIPHNVPILLKRTADSVTEPIMAKAYQGTESQPAANELEGTASSKAISTVTGGDVYVLYNDGFTRATSGSIPAHRAYLVINKDAESRLFIWEDEDATRISTVGRGFATTSETLYNLNGQRVSQPSKGLYISNGKKRIVK